MWQSSSSRSQAWGLFILFFVIGLDLLATFSLAVPISVSTPEKHALQARWDGLPSEEGRKIRKDKKVKKELDEAKVPVIGVDSMLKKMKDAGFAGRLPDVFYTGDVDKDLVYDWAQLKFKETTDPCLASYEIDPDNWRYAAWHRLLGDDLNSRSILEELGTKFRKSMDGAISGGPGTYANIVRSWWDEVSQKNAAQAYAEASHGDVYVVANLKLNAKNDLNLWSQFSAWGGWELPALTRNPNVKKIVRVTLSRDANQEVVATETEIWTRASTEEDTKKTTMEPKGIRKDMVTDFEFMVKRTKPPGVFSSQRWAWYPFEVVQDLMSKTSKR